MSAIFIIALGLPRPYPLILCSFGAQKVTTNGLPHAIYYTVASPCQTRDVTVSQFAEGLHFSALLLAVCCSSFACIRRHTVTTSVCMLRIIIEMDLCRDGFV